VVVEPIGKGRRVPVAERVKVWWIGAEEPVVPAARLLEKPITHADLAQFAVRSACDYEVGEPSDAVLAPQ
jgi:hypothetical protein